MNVEINAIRDGARDFTLIALHLRCRAGAAFFGVPKVAAGTRIHRGDELKLARKNAAPLPTPQCELLGFERFAQTF